MATILIIISSAKGGGYVFAFIYLFFCFLMGCLKKLRSDWLKFGTFERKWNSLKNSWAKLGILCVKSLFAILQYIDGEWWDYLSVKHFIINCPVHRECGFFFNNPFYRNCCTILFFFFFFVTFIRYDIVQRGFNSKYPAVSTVQEQCLTMVGIGYCTDSFDHPY